jgi:hypothetical protein
MQTLAFRSCESSSRRYLVLLHTAEEPRLGEWREYVSAVQATLAGASERVYAFVATDGGSPNAIQRRLLADVVMRGPHGAQTLVFTTDTFIRSVVTAFSWIAKPGASAHAPREFADICTKHGLAPREVLQEFTSLQKSFPRVLTLERIVESMRVRDAS